MKKYLDGLSMKEKEQVEIWPGVDQRIEDAISKAWEERESDLRMSIMQEVCEDQRQDALPEINERNKETSSSVSSEWTVVSQTMNALKDHVEKLASAHNGLAKAFEETRKWLLTSRNEWTI